MTQHFSDELTHLEGALFTEGVDPPGRGKAVAMRVTVLGGDSKAPGRRRGRWHYETHKEAETQLPAEDGAYTPVSSAGPASGRSP